MSNTKKKTDTKIEWHLLSKESITDYPPVSFGGPQIKTTVKVLGIANEKSYEAEATSLVLLLETTSGLDSVARAIETAKQEIRDNILLDELADGIKILTDNEVALLRIIQKLKSTPKAQPAPTVVCSHKKRRDCLYC
jgi:hypothetical protein